MYEEGVLKWESILTVLIGIAILAFIFLLLYKRKVAKRKRIERESDLRKSNIELQNNQETIIDKNIPANETENDY